MTMRKHKVKRNFNRPMPWPNTPKQYIATLDMYAKLIGIRTGMEAILDQIAEANKLFTRHMERAGNKETPIAERQLTELDKMRLARASARRLKQNTTRCTSYAKCIAGNWGKALIQSDYMSTVRVANKLEVDKAFVRLHGG